MHREREVAADGIAGEQDLIWCDLLVEQPSVGGEHIFCRCWELTALVDQAVARQQCPHSDSFGQVAVQLAVGINGARDEATAVDGEEHLVLGSILRDCPQSCSATGVHFDVVHTAWLAGQADPGVLDHLLLIVAGPVRALCGSRDPTAVQLRDGL
ncbi:hypothetical protein GCM10009630_17680 [Kribbella jejuensis]